MEIDIVNYHFLFSYVIYFLFPILYLQIWLAADSTCNLRFWTGDFIGKLMFDLLRSLRRKDWSREQPSHGPLVAEFLYCAKILKIIGEYYLWFRCLSTRFIMQAVNVPSRALLLYRSNLRVHDLEVFDIAQKKKQEVLSHFWRSENLTSKPALRCLLFWP